MGGDRDKHRWQERWRRVRCPQRFANTDKARIRRRGQTTADELNRRDHDAKRCISTDLDPHKSSHRREQCHRYQWDHDFGDRSGHGFLGV
eukprot:28496-Pelagococcus_subviridis.AAC.1